MSIFNLTDFERQGNIENDETFNSLDQLRSYVSLLASGASRTIQIYTPDLEPVIYDNQEFVDQLLSMARGNRHAKIQILVLDTSQALHYGHALLRLAHSLTSIIEIRIPSSEYQQDNLAFMLVDGKGFIYRPDTTTFNGIYNPDCRVRSQKLSEIFTTSWEHAEQDPQTRRLSI